MNINMTTARDVQAAADLADINEETLLAECKATKVTSKASIASSRSWRPYPSRPMYPCLISSRRLSFGCSSLGRRNECRTNSGAHAEGIGGKAIKSPRHWQEHGRRTAPCPAYASQK